MMFWINENDLILYRDVGNDVATRQRSTKILPTLVRFGPRGNSCQQAQEIEKRGKSFGDNKIWALQIIQRFRYNRSFRRIKCRCKFFPSENLLYIRPDFSLQEKIYFKTSEEMVDSSLCCIFSSYIKKSDMKRSYEPLYNALGWTIYNKREMIVRMD